MKKQKKLVLASVLVLLCVVLAGCGTKEVNLNDYVEIETKGYNGYGNLDVDISWGKISDALKISKKDADEYKNLRQFFNANGISYTVDKKEGLSNGETVVLTWNVDESLISQKTNRTIVCDDSSFVVEGLEEVPLFDAFETLEVFFEGKNGKASAIISGGREGFQYDLNMKKTIMSGGNQYYNLSNGDVVVVEISIGKEIEALAKEYGSLPKEIAKEYVVSGLDENISSFADMTAEENAELEDLASWYLDNNILYSDDWSEYKLIEKTVHKKGLLCYVYEISKTNSDYKYYWDIVFTSVVRKGNGTLEVDPRTVYYPDDWSPSVRMRYMYEHYCGYETLEELKKDVSLIYGDALETGEIG